MNLRAILSRRWWKATLLVILAMGVMVRLGIWQLDRLAQRRAFNARVLAQINRSPLTLKGSNMNQDLVNMEYREIIVEGIYDFSQQVVLRNQAWNNQIGVHLITPLHISGSDQSILVDRGWIPYEDFISGNWSNYDEPGQVKVKGVIRRSQEKADFGWRADPTLAPGEDRLTAWNLVNVVRIGDQISVPVLPVYIQQSPDPSWTSLPYRGQPDIELTEGPHLGYAIQWFCFAAILGIGYPIFIRREENRDSPPEREKGLQNASL
jgi:surfeit locus 1 family protein